MDVYITKHMHNLFTSNKIMNQAIYVMGVIPYKLIVYFGTLFAIIMTLLIGSKNSLRLIIFPMFFASTVVGYLEITLPRIRPGCRFRKFSKTMDPASCEGQRAFTSLPCRQTLMFTAVITSILLYLQDRTIPDHNKTLFMIPFYKTWIQKMIISILSILLLITSMERIIDGYNYFSDVILGLGLGYVIGYTSFKLCSESMNEEVNTIQWLSMRFLGCILCLFVLVRFLLDTIPTIIQKRALIMKPTYFRRVTRKAI